VSVFVIVYLKLLDSSRWFLSTGLTVLKLLIAIAPHVWMRRLRFYIGYQLEQLRQCHYNVCDCRLDGFGDSLFTK